MVRGLAALLFQGRAASPSFGPFSAGSACRHCLSSRHRQYISAVTPPWSWAMADCACRIIGTSISRRTASTRRKRQIGAAVGHEVLRYLRAPQAALLSKSCLETLRQSQVRSSEATLVQLQVAIYTIAQSRGLSSILTCIWVSSKHQCATPFVEHNLRMHRPG